MYQVKKKIISTMLVLSALLMVAGVTAMTANAIPTDDTKTGFTEPLTYQGEVSTFLSMTHSSAIISHVTGYSTNSKYASCTSWHLDGTTYVKQDWARSGNVTTEVANSANDHNLLVNGETEKAGYYGHIRIGSAHNTAYKDRYWIYRYKNPDLSSCDDAPQFSYFYQGDI